MNAPLKGKELAAFRKLAVPEQLRALRGQKVERVFTIDRANGIDEKARTAWLSIASDAPYERWWGTEVLDMSPSSIRQDRLKLGAPLLVGHDSADQVGVVENYEITGDKKLRVLARFGRSARAAEIFADVLDGIRRNASVGYIIHDLVLEKQEEDVSTYRVTDWEPLEGSLVAVPADPTVGVGRGLEPPAPPIPFQEKTMNEAELKAKAEAEAKAKAEAEAKARADAELKAKAEQDALSRERERVGALMAAAKEYANLGGAEIADACIKSGESVDHFKAKMLEAMRGRSKPIPTAAPGTGAPGGERQSYGEGARVRYQYGALKAFRDLPIEGGGVMKAEEAAYRAGMWMAAQIYRKPWAAQKCKDLGIQFAYRDEVSGEVRVMNENVLGQGAALVPVELEASIIMLRDRYGVARRLARVRPMGADTLQIPRRKGGITAYFFQDDDGVGITSSDKNWDNVGLHAKKVGALGKLSRDLIEDAVISVVDDMAQEQAYAFAKLEDQCLIIGDGTSTYGGIQGIQTKFDGTAYVSRIAAATGHNLFTEFDNADLTAVMAGVSQYAIGPGAVWLTSAAGSASIFGRLKAIAGGNRVDTLGMAPDDSYLGYPIVTSEACRNGPATDYVNKSVLFFGRFDLGCSMGSRRGIEVQVLQERYAELGLIGIISTERFDIVVHDLGDATSVKGPIAALYGA